MGCYRFPGAVWLLTLLYALPCGCRKEESRAGRRKTSKIRKTRKVDLSAKFDRVKQPYAFVLPQLKPVSGVGGVRAEQCGSCHVKKYQEWKGSTHASALRDLQYQAELFKKTSPQWLCLNCHIPVANQRHYTVRYLENGDVLRPVTAVNRGFYPIFMGVGVTCAGCHVRPDEKGKSVVVGPVGNGGAPHPVRKDEAFLRNICFRCHDPRGEAITPTLVCWFHTRKEVAEGPFGGKKDCVDCHMPAIRRRLSVDKRFPVRNSRRHVWEGGGVPKGYDGYDSLLGRGYRPGLDAKLVRWEADRGGGRVEFALSVRNARAGHWLPTADPERHLLLQAELRDGKGKRVAVVRSRIGQKWKWAPRAEKVSDNRLKPGEERTWQGRVEVPVPARARVKALRLVMTVYHVRLTAINAHELKQAKVTERYVPGLRKYLKALERHYPMATFVFREEVELGSGKRRVAGAAELIELSKGERVKTLTARDY